MYFFRVHDNELTDCESINADLDLIYHEIYWECKFLIHFSVLVKKGKIRVWIVSKKSAPGQKSATLKKNWIFTQTQFRILGSLCKQTTDGVQHLDLLKLLLLQPIFYFLLRLFAKHQTLSF